MNYISLEEAQACIKLNRHPMAPQPGTIDHDRTSAGVTQSLDAGVPATSYASSGFIGKSNSTATTPAGSNINDVGGHFDQTTTPPNPSCSTTSDVAGLFGQSTPICTNNSERGYNISFMPCPGFSTNFDMPNIVGAYCARCSGLVELDRLFPNGSTVCIAASSNHLTDSGKGKLNTLSNADSCKSGCSNNVEESPHFRLTKARASTPGWANNGHGPPFSLSNTDSYTGCSNNGGLGGPLGYSNASTPSRSNSCEQAPPFGLSNATNSYPVCSNNLGLGSFIRSNASSQTTPIPGFPNNNGHGASISLQNATYSNTRCPTNPGHGPSYAKSNTASSAPCCANSSGHETHFCLSNATRSTPTCSNTSEHGPQISLSNVNTSHPGLSNNSGLALFAYRNANDPTTVCHNNSEYSPVFAKKNYVDSLLGRSNNIGQGTQFGQSNATTSNPVCSNINEHASSCGKPNLIDSYLASSNNSSLRGPLGHSNATTSYPGCTNISAHEKATGRSNATASECSTTVDLSRFVNQSAITSSTPQITINFGGSSGQPLADSIPGGSLAIIFNGPLTQPSTAISSTPCGPSGSFERYDRPLGKSTATSTSVPKCPITLDELKEGLHEIFGICGSDGHGPCRREDPAKKQSQARSEHPNANVSKPLLAIESCPSLPFSQQFEYGDDLYQLTVFEDSFTKECHEGFAHCTVQHISAPKPNQNLFFDVSFRKSGLLVMSGAIKASAEPRASQRISAATSDIVGSDICVSKTPI